MEVDMNRSRASLSLVALAIAAAAHAGAALAVPAYRCVYLADARSEDLSWPEAIGADGTIVGLGSANAYGPRAARLKGTQVQDLGKPDAGRGPRFQGLAAHEYIARIATAPTSQVAVEARLGYEVGALHAIIRGLVSEVSARKHLIRVRDEMLVDAGLIEVDVDDGPREQAAFARSTGAADALRGQS